MAWEKMIRPISFWVNCCNENLILRYGWWFRNLANQLTWWISHYSQDFFTSQVVVWDFWTINSINCHNIRINQDVCNLGAKWGAPPSPRPPLLGGNQVGDAGHLERTSPKDQVLGCQGSKRCIATVGMWCCDLWIALEPHLLENTCTPRVDSPPRRIFTNVSKWNLMNKVLKYL